MTRTLGARRPRLDVVVGLNYYHPYVSGLSELARATAEHLAQRGMRVRVITSRHDPSLARFEVRNGVEIERTAVVMRIRNGVLAPTLPFVIARRARQASLCHLHLPMLEAGITSHMIGSTPLLVTYHCDYESGDDLFGRAIRGAIDRSSRTALERASDVVTTSIDYATSSRVYEPMRGKLHAIPPPFVPRPGGSPTFRRGDGLHIGALGRIVDEKGLNYLIRAFRTIPEPDARLLIAGDYESIAGRSVIAELRALADGDSRVSFLGFLPDHVVADFFASLDVFAFPSVNPLEAFGITQLEALSAGLPIVASDLPGVRLPVQTTGRGTLVPPRDVEALARALTAPNLRDVARTPVTDPGPTAEQQYERLVGEIFARARPVPAEDSELCSESTLSSAR